MSKISRVCKLLTFSPRLWAPILCIFRNLKINNKKYCDSDEPSSNFRCWFVFSPVLLSNLCCVYVPSFDPDKSSYARLELSPCHFKHTTVLTAWLPFKPFTVATTSLWDGLLSLELPLFYSSFYIFVERMNKRVDWAHRVRLKLRKTLLNQAR